MAMSDLEKMYRCRACLQKYGGKRECPNCPTQEELAAPVRQEVEGQTSMFDFLEGGENE